MAVMGYSYDPSVREDLLGIITNITPRETQLMSGLGTSSAKGVIHDWLEDTLEAAANNGYIEGVDASFVGFNTTRARNILQISRRGYQVSDSLKAVDGAGYADALAYASS